MKLPAANKARFPVGTGGEFNDAVKRYLFIALSHCLKSGFNSHRQSNVFMVFTAVKA